MSLIVHPIWQNSRLQHLTALLDAKIKFVVHGNDALHILYRTPLYYACVPIPQHVLVPDDAVGHAAHILSSTYGYAIFNNPPFPTDLTDSVYAFRLSTALQDGNSATVVLYHPNPKYDGARCIFLHPSSTFQFDLDDPSRTLANPHPPDPSLAAILFPIEVAFLDSVVDIIFERPFSVTSTMVPFRKWLYDMFRYSLCAYPNDWEDLYFGEGEYEELEWREGTRRLDAKDIPVLEYISLVAKEENCSYLLTQINPLAPDVDITWSEMDMECHESPLFYFLHHDPRLPREHATYSH